MDARRFRRMVVPCACALAACAPALDWRELRPAGSGALLLFPCKPSVQERLVALAGPPVRLTLHACTAAGHTWGFSRADVVDPVRVGPALAALGAGAAANLGLPAAPVTPWPVPGATPNERSGRASLAGRLPDGQPVQMQLALFAHGTQVFQATVLATSLSAEASTNFFDSLRFDR